ncbi:membrane protein [Stenotrophomonas ginsengisoli]|uniref:Membrane protein n=1 Tax=Stenotrophomonas ginsengisoli TaxID=336566 RepID=A0A0R0D376_9GAMM|nr:DUF808 domain-containing protein [Stenotrophomonas ginsengisoli]KRG76553.1 membrane protein [Stenotrophomonas ginsengisoli]
MAGASLFMLIDDIATLLDDVAVLTKLATKKTAGVLGDDLALNAQQVTGVSAARELPVIWAVAKGSLVNKAILVPAALAISALEVWLRGRGIDIPIIVTLMLIGGSFLCFEGVEKLVHHFFHKHDEDREMQRQARLEAMIDTSVDVVALEKEKVSGAIRTDFILSAEVIVLTLGIVAAASFGQQVITLIAIAVAMTVFVYGLVGGIVKIDDLGLWLSRKGGVSAVIGRGLVASAPILMKVLSVVGTLAMFLVGGGIVVHNVPAVHHAVAALLPQSGWGNSIGNALASLVVGVIVGALVLGVVSLVKRLFGGKSAH